MKWHLFSALVMAALLLVHLLVTFPLGVRAAWIALAPLYIFLKLSLAFAHWRRQEDARWRSWKLRTLALLVVAHVGCAGPQRVTAINTVDTMADAAGVALRAYSHEHIEAIIHRPNITAAAAQTEMTAFYAKVDKAESDLTDLRGLIKNARAVNDAPTLNALEAKAASIVAELKAFEVP